MTFPGSPVREIVAAVLVLAGVLSAVGGTRRLVRGLDQAVSLDVILGGMGWTIALAVAFATGMLADQTGFLVLGAVFLAEELYETGIVALIIRSGDTSASDGPV